MQSFELDEDHPVIRDYAAFGVRDLPEYYEVSGHWIMSAFPTKEEAVQLAILWSTEHHPSDRHPEERHLKSTVAWVVNKEPVYVWAYRRGKCRGEYAAYDNTLH